MSDRPRPDRHQGVFETLLIVSGRPIELDAHLARLAASLASLFPDHTAPDLGELDVSSGDAVLGSMRVTVAPSGENTLEARVTLREVEPTLVFGLRPVALHSLPLAGGLGAHKWADRSLLDEAQSRLPADSLPLIVDSDGAALEVSRANVFALRDGALVTPPTDGRILPGITRMRAMELAAAAAGLETREATLHHDDLLTAEEVFLTGSVRGVEPVRALDGVEIATGGDVGPLVAAELRRIWTSVQVR